MPWKTVDELRSSKLFKRMSTLQKMGTSRLSKFLSVFNEVYERAVRGGAKEDEAETRAIAIALTAARKQIAPPAGRNVESMVYTVALMAKHMEHGGGGNVLDTVSTDLRFPAIEDINSVMVGNAFHGPTHRESNPDIAEPLGIIRSVLASKDVPEEVRGKIDPDIEVVATVSYFEDVPNEERLSTISPEWLEFEMKDGSVLAVPYNFVVTPEPANDPIMGIKVVAERSNPVVGKPHKERVRSEVWRTMPDGDSPDATKEAVWQRQAEAFKNDLEQTKAKLAEAQRKAEELIRADRQRQAEDFASKTFAAKEVPVEAQKKLAAMHLKDPEGAEEWASMLQDRALKPGAGKAATGVAPQDGANMEAAIQRMSTNVAKTLESGRVL